MKQLKNVLAIMVMAFGLMITTNACRDPCKDVNCNNGTCEEGTCKCEDGYTGANCDTAWRAGAIGNFNVRDVVTGEEAGTYLYESNITTGTNIKDIRIANFGGLEATINGTFTNATAFNVPSQTDAANIKYSGNGTVSGNQIVITYSAVFPDNTVSNGTATYTRKQ
jgi:hypothetical protein